MYTTLLAIHLLCAALTGVQGIRAVFALIAGATPDTYRHHATNLGTLGMVTIGSGTLLAIVSVKISAASLCSNVVTYLGTIMLIEFFLAFRLKNLQQAFPLTQTASRLALGVTPFVFALVVGA